MDARWLPALDRTAPCLLAGNAPDRAERENTDVQTRVWMIKLEVGAGLWAAVVSQGIKRSRSHSKRQTGLIALPIVAV